MKNALLKDTFREIHRTFSRFLSIFAIVALGVSFFAGVKATCPDMKVTADTYFDDYRLMDMRLVSTIGFNDEDIKAIRKTNGVEGVYPTYSIDALVKVKKRDIVFEVLSLPMDKLYNPDENYINRVKLVSGRFPQSMNECVIETGNLTDTGLALGSKIKLSSGTDWDISQNLKISEYTIVGTVESPYYISFERGTSSIGNGKVDSFLMVPHKNFKLPVYTDVFVTVDGSREEPSYDDSYDDVVEPVKEALEDLGEDRAKTRYDEILSYAYEELDSQKWQINDAELIQNMGLDNATLDILDSKLQIIRGEMELHTKKNDFERTIRDAEESISAGYKKLEDGENEYNQQLQDFNNTKQQAVLEFAAAEQKLYDAQRELSSSEEELNKLKAYLSSGKNLSEIEVSQIKSIIETSERQLSEGKRQLEESKAVLQANKNKLTEAEAKLNDAKKTLDDSRQQLESQAISLENYKKTAGVEFSNAGINLNNSKDQIGKGESSIESAKLEVDKTFFEAKEKIDEAEDEINDIEEPEWFVLDRDTNPGFVEYGGAADRMDAIASVFPVFFFLIAALVCLTTMTRMIDEQRTYIGTLKALGYSKLSIALKYLLYAALASTTGSLFGLAIGFNLFPTIITNAYGIMYTMPPVITEFNVYYASISTGIAVLTTTLAAFLACNKELLMTPALLMRPKAPKAGKRIFLERIRFIWSRFNFTQKITARNMFRYKKRFFMTVLGISGCTALLLTGYGLKDSIMSITSKQFDELYKYDMSIILKDSIKSEESPEIITDISKDSRIIDYILIKEQNVDVSKEDIEKSTSLIVPKNSKRWEDFVTFRVRTTGKKVPFTDEGVILTEKLAKLLGAGIGDQIYITDEDDKKVAAKVTGITEHYVSHYIYMSPALYNSLYGEKADFQQIKARIADTSKDFEDKLSTDLIKDSDVSSISFITNISNSFSDVITSLNYVVLVLIVSAGALAFVVLYNLTNINITERLREIATIKVLGFYDNEVSSYVYRENAVLTIIGIIAGLVMGIFLHRYIIVTTEIENTMFGREIKLLSFTYSAILTLVFAGFVNLVMYFRLKKITMVESLKSVD